MTIQPLSQSVAGPITNNAKPEFLRLPKPGTLCPHSGLGRTVMYELCKEHKVQSVVLRRRGATRGIRLVNYDSLMGYLHSLGS